MRVATWNVDSIRARLSLVEAWLLANDVDVLALQEVKCPPDRFPRSVFAAHGYETAVHSASGQGGVALLSRVGLDDVVLGIPGAKAPLAEPRSISATAGGLRIHTMYTPNGRKVGQHSHQVKLAWLTLFGSWLEIDGLADRPTLVAGDLNVAPLDIDVWDASRYRKRNLTSPVEREAFATLLDRGLVDVARQHLGDRHGFTWWNRRSDFYESDRGWRLDHILADPATAAAVTHFAIDRAERGRQGSSDHAPLLVDVDVSSL